MLKRLSTTLMIALLAAATAGASVVPDPALPGRNSDFEQAEYAAALPGFGGLFYDQTGQPTVYLTDPAGLAAAARLQFGDQVQILAGDYDFRDLRAWRIALREDVLAVPGVVLLDVDESRNRVRVGVDPAVAAEARPLIDQALAANGVPAAAVVVDDAEPIHRLATLRDKFRPAPGGVQINFPGFLCTLGFNAYRSGTFGFITNSHCTTTQGGTEGTVYQQPDTAGGAIATELSDPVYWTGSGCPAGRRCRYSDSAFAYYHSASYGEFRKIARTTSYGTSSGSLTIDGANPRFTITARKSFPSSGEVLDKIGRTTGWTYGSVTSTCTDTNVAGTNITQLCQDHVSGGVNGGDSGSPVFYWSGGSNVTLYGVLWGGGGNSFVFSALWNIEIDQGAIQVH